MKTPLRSLAALGLCALSLLLSANQSRAELSPIIESGDTWRYLDTGASLTTGGGATTDWRMPSYVEAGGTWKSGISSFGYRTVASPASFDKNEAATQLNFNAGNVVANPKYITTYFRKTFDLTSAQKAALGAYVLGAQWDDGFVIYLNGNEVWRQNMPTGAVTGTTLASAAINKLTAMTTRNFSFSTGAQNYFLAGTNVIAVELHQAATNSSDVYFDLTLSTSQATVCFGDATVGLFNDMEQDLETSLYAPHNVYLRTPPEGSGLRTNAQLQYDYTFNDIDLTQQGFNDPGLFGSAGVRQLQFKRNSAFNIITERIDAHNFKNIQASIQLRSENVDNTTPWSSNDFIKGTVLVSTDGAEYQEIPWFKYQASPTSVVETTLVSETDPYYWQVPAISGAIISDASNTNPVTITTTTNHNFVTGNTVTIGGVMGNTAANGNFTVTKVAANTFTLNGVSGVGLAASTYTVSSASAATPIVITTSGNHPFVTGNSVTVTGVPGNTAANGTFTITKLSATTFSLTGTTSTVASTGATGKVYAANQFVVRNNATTHPLDWFKFQPTAWTGGFSTPPAQGGLTANFWRSGNLAGTAVKGGVGYDDSTTAPAVNYLPFIDNGSITAMRADLFGKETRVNARVPFTVPVTVSSVIKAELTLRFEDAVAVWLASSKDSTTQAGVKVVSDLEPANDAIVVGSRADATAIVPKTYDITSLFKSTAVAGGNNVLCIRAFNGGAGSSDLLAQWKLTITAPSAIPDPTSPQQLELATPPGGEPPLTTLTTPLGMISDGVKSIKIRIQGGVTGQLPDTSENQDYKFVYFKNIGTTGDPLSGVDMNTTLAYQLPKASYSAAKRVPSADPDGDGIPNLLEYAFGSDAAVAKRFGATGSSTMSLTPDITVLPSGFINMEFRMLEGLIDYSTLSRGGIAVNDLIYFPQVSEATAVGDDWTSVQQFVVDGAPVLNDDGTQTVKILTTTRQVGTELSPTNIFRKFFRIKVENTRDPWLNPSTDTPCPFPE